MYKKKIKTCIGPGEEFYLTWDDLEDFYYKKTGCNMYGMSMNSLYEWAIAQDEVIVDIEKGIRFKEEFQDYLK